MARDGGADVVRVMLSYFLPPVGVFLQSGIGVPLLINLVLTFFGYLPGVVHAVWVIASTRSDGREDPEGGTNFVSLVCGYFLPPAGVLMKRGVGIDLVINVVLTAFLWIPGQLHAAWVICSD